MDAVRVMGAVRDHLGDALFRIMRGLVLDAATSLVIEENNNPEYDRALVEMSCRLLGLPIDENSDTIAELIGVKRPSQAKADAYWAEIALRDMHTRGDHSACDHPSELNTGGRDG